MSRDVTKTETERFYHRTGLPVPTETLDHERIAVCRTLHACRRDGHVRSYGGVSEPDGSSALAMFCYGRRQGRARGER